MEKEQKIHFHEPNERKDLGRINYTSVPTAIDNWRQDPFGNRALRFLNEAYGVNPKSGILEQAGMAEYLQYKQEGRFIGFVAAQILKPTFYYLSNAIILGELAKRGIPTTLMVFEYPQDIFLSRNPDKRRAFGNIDFFVNERKSVQVKVNPIGIKNQPLPIRTINDADGFPCQNVLINHNGAALGIDIADGLSLTDFYKILWQASIDRLRRQGILPPETQMPVFYVDMTKLYSTLAATAQPNAKLLDQLLFSRGKRPELFRLSGLASDFNDDDLPGTKLRFAPNGLLIQNNGMMDAASYYPLQTAWPDLYLECSSCGGDYFVEKLARAQQLKYDYGVPEVEIRLPDTEVPELENLCLHPSGRLVDFNLNPEWKKISDQIRSLADQLPKLPPEQVAQKMRLSPSDYQLKIKLIKQIKQLRIEQEQLFLQPQEYIRKISFSLPPAVEQVYNQLLSGVPEHV